MGRRRAEGTRTERALKEAEEGLRIRLELRHQSYGSSSPSAEERLRDRIFERHKDILVELVRCTPEDKRDRVIESIRTSIDRLTERDLVNQVEERLLGQADSPAPTFDMGMKVK